MFKKNIIICFIFAVLSLLISSSVFASRDVTAKYYSNISKVIISFDGDKEYSAEKPVTVCLTNDDSSNFTYFNDFLSNDNILPQKYEICMNLDDIIESGVISVVNIDDEAYRVPVENIDPISLSECYIENDILTVKGEYYFEQGDDSLTLKISNADGNIITNTINADYDTYSFENSINLKNVLDYGDYQLELCNSNGLYSAHSEFKYINVESVLEEVSSSIGDENASLDQKITRVKQLLCNNDSIHALGLDKYIIDEGITVANMSDEMWKYFINNNGLLVSTQDLKNELKKAYITDLVLSMPTDGEDYFELIKNKSQDFKDISQLKVYSYYINNMTADERTVCMQEFRTKDNLCFDDMLNNISNIIILKTLNKCANWSELKTFIDDNAFLNSDETVLSDLLISLLDKIPYSDIETFINDLNALKTTKTTITQGSYDASSHVSSSSGSGSFSVSDKSINVGASNVSSTFIDLNNSQWARTAIEYLYSKKIINGKGNNMFCPDELVTREEYVKMLVQMFDLSSFESELSFSDVIPGEWYYDYINKGVFLGIVNGINDASFGIGQPVTREDAAVMIYRTMILKSIINDNTEGNITYTDSKEISDYAKKAVGVLSNINIVKGMGDGTFSPQSTCSRAQAAQMLYNLLTID